MIRFGRCDEKTEQYFYSLSRDIPSPVGNKRPTHIYVKRLPVELHNASVLTSLSGSELTFEWVDTCIGKSLDKSADVTLALKPSCKVMLIYNINYHLKNGTCGEFVGIDSNGEGLWVNFSNVGTITIQYVASMTPLERW